jgi:uncharacterized protein YggE
MKQHHFSLVALILAATAAAAPGEETVPGRALVSTTGSAEIRVVPDLADLIFQVEVRNANLSQAQKEEAERVTKVLAALRGAGITEAELQTSQVEIAPRYDNHVNELALESTAVRFYSVSQHISCTLHEVKRIPAVTADAVSAGVTGINGAVLRTSELRMYRDQARAKAIRAAKEKAVALASELGAKVGRPYTITENATESRWLWPAYNTANSQVNEASGARAIGDTTESTFAPGRITVSASVSVSFILE